MLSLRLISFYLFQKLPAAWFMGVRPIELTEAQCRVAVPFGWSSQNPFRSIYFAAQCAAGEMAGGLMAMNLLRGRPPCSMLVVRVEAEFYKKANRRLVFTCTDGALIKKAIDEAFHTQEAQTVRIVSTGVLPDGVEAARVWVTWSFRAK